MVSKERVKHFFSGQVREWAANYSDIDMRSLGVETLASRQRFAVEIVETHVPRASRVLDVGCGPGELSAKLMRCGYEVWGMDIAQPMVRHARERCDAGQFWVGDIERMPFRNATFDAVVCQGVMEYLASDEQALREIWRVLKPGGRAVISTPSAVCPLYHMDRMLFSLMAAARPLVHIVKYRLRGRRPPSGEVVRPPSQRRYYPRRWLRLLRSVDLEPEQWVRYGWGWYTSWPLGRSVQFLSRLFRRTLERFFGDAALCRVSHRFARCRALNWVFYELLVGLRAAK